MRLAIFLFLVLFVLKTHAQWSGDSSEQRDWEESLIYDNRAIADWFDGVAEGLDLFLSGKKVSAHKNETRLTVETGLFWSEKDAFSNASSFNLNLRLPNVEEYWNLTFSSYDETKERSVTQAYLRQSARERDYGARVGFFKKLGRVRTAFQPRLALAGRFKISHSLTFESVAERPNGYRVNPKLEFYADADEGTGSFMSLNFNFTLTRHLSLTFINEGDYKDRSHSYAVTHGVSLGHRISQLKLETVGLYFNFSNEPNYQLKEYVVRYSWNQMVYRNMLGFEVVPYWAFSQMHNYVGYVGLSTYLRIYF